jgi:hypothetical protein
MAKQAAITKRKGRERVAIAKMRQQGMHWLLLVKAGNLGRDFEAGFSAS